MKFFLAVAAIASLVLAASLWSRYASLRRESHIRGAEFPRGLFEKLKSKLMDHPAAATAAAEVVAAVEAAAAAEETEARPNALSVNLERSRIDLTAVDVLGRWCGAKESRLTWPVGSRSRNELAERRSGAWVQLGTPLTCTLRF